MVEVFKQKRFENKTGDVAAEEDSNNVNYDAVGMMLGFFFFTLVVNLQKLTSCWFKKIFSNTQYDYVGY